MTKSNFISIDLLNTEANGDEKDVLDKLLIAKQKRFLRVKKIISIRQSKPNYYKRRCRSGSNCGGNSPSSVSSSGSSYGFSAAELRKHERKIRNRQSAMNSRMKIRAEVDILQEKISKLLLNNLLCLIILMLNVILSVRTIGK